MATVACYNFSYSLGNCLGSLGKSTRTLSFVHRSLKVRVLNLQYDFRLLRGSVCVYDCYRYTGTIAELSYWSLYEYPSNDYSPHEPEHPLF
jgi:hypothetical protein